MNEAPDAPKTKRKKGKPSPPSFPITPVSDLLAVRIFREVPKELLNTLDQKVRRASAEAEETIIEFFDDPDFFRYFFFIVKGQVKIVGFDEEAHSRTLNFLRKGEFFVDKSVAWKGMVSTKAVAITDTELLILHRDDLKALSVSYPPIQKKLRETSDRIDHRNRIYCEDKYSRSVLDFLVDTALTQASRVKITQMDKCIECDTCYDACEERHGFQRITRGYARFGVLDVAQSCLTCFYPTCIPSCPVDSVVYNSQKGEVEILDDCIGCQACARACQYGAIKMYKVQEDEKRFERFLAPDRKIKPKFIADKCNHCYGFHDLACISNCPTGAIIEVGASDLLENPTIFGVSEKHRTQLPSLTENPWILEALQKFYFVVGAAITGWLSYEFFVIERWPGLSILKLIQSKGLLDAKDTLTFQKGSDLCLFLGNLGFTLIVIAMLYPLRKAFPKLFKNLGKKPIWLDLHNFCGLLGTILVLFHTGFVITGSIGSLGMIALVFVMLSGMFGRFLYMVIPRGVAGNELRIKDIEERDLELTHKLDNLFDGNLSYKKTLEDILAASLKLEQKQSPTLRNLFQSVIKSQVLIWKLRLKLPEHLKQYKRHMGTFIKLLKEKIRLQRNVVFLEFSSRLFIKWQYFHKPFAYIMGILAIFHVIYNLLFFSWNK